MGQCWKRSRKRTLLKLNLMRRKRSCARFSVPEKSEGFDEIKFNWTKDAKCKEHVKNYVLAKKATTRIEDLTPSDWFKKKFTQWEKSLDQWHQKLREYEAAVAKKAKE